MAKGLWVKILSTAAQLCTRKRIWKGLQQMNDVESHWGRPNQKLLYTIGYTLAYSLLVGFSNKSSEVAEIDDRLATIDISWKEGVLCPFRWEELGLHLTLCGLARRSVPSGILIHPAVWPQ